MILAAGGALVAARMAELSLRLADESDAHGWVAPVWFCEPWTLGFGLLGLTGLFDHFELTIASMRSASTLPRSMPDLLLDRSTRPELDAS